MKQHSVAHLNTYPLKDDSRPENVLTLASKWITGKWRLYWNFCPESNSFAPKIRCCDVCDGDMHSTFHWSNDVQQLWWQRYAEKHHLPLNTIRREQLQNKLLALPIDTYSSFIE